MYIRMMAAPQGAVWTVGLSVTLPLKTSTGTRNEGAIGREDAVVAVPVASERPYVSKYENER
jgi:hypothetical protein